MVKQTAHGSRRWYRRPAPRQSGYHGRMRELRRVALSAVCCSAICYSWTAGAAPTRVGEVIPNPYAPTGVPPYIDFSHGKIPTVTHDSGVRFEDLDAHMDLSDATLPEDQADRPGLPEGWVQIGGMVVPRAFAEGADVRTPGSMAGISGLSDAPRPTRGKVMGPTADDLCAFPDETPEGIYTGEYNRGSEFPRRGTIFMNYTGGKLVSGGENSAENKSSLAKTGSTYPVYLGGEEKAVAVAQAVAADFAELAVRVVYLKRPPKLLPYVMIMMGGRYTDTTSGPAGGVAPGADCEDAGLRNVCYAFVKGSAITDQSNIASQEIGHTMGLGHTFGKDRVMAYGYDTNSNIDMGFGDVCSTVLIAEGQAGYCAGVNKCHCGSDGKQQHDLNSLKAIYTAPGPDMVPPTISITSPEDGAVFPVGETIKVDVEPMDNFGGYGWELVVRQGDEVLAEVVDYELAQQFLVGGLPPGTYTFTARVQDHDDQVGEDLITVTVQGEGGQTESDSDTPTTSEGEGGSSGDPSDPSNPSDGSSGSGGSDSADTTSENADDGCSCSEAPHGSTLAPLALLGLLGLRRRRTA